MNMDNFSHEEVGGTQNIQSAGETLKSTPQNPNSSNKSSRKRLTLIVGVLFGFLLFGFGGYYFGLQRSDSSSKEVVEIQEVPDEATPETIGISTNDTGLVSYIDENRNFQIKLPINTVERSQAYYNFGNMEPYTAEVISSSGNFPEVSVEISDSGAKPFIPTNFEVDDETTLSIGGRFNIQATRKFGYLYDTQSRRQTYVVYYLTFERNNEIYLVKYSPPIAKHRSNPQAHDAIFEQIIDSIKFTGIHIVPDSELIIKDSARYYTDPQLKYTVLVPDGWNVSHGGDNADPLIIVTDEPIEEVYQSKGIDSEYKRIYFSRSGIIFSTSGGVCANVGCEDNGIFTTTINGIKYTAEITLTARVQNRFIIDTKTVKTGGIYIGAAYPSGSTTRDIQNIISSVQFE